MFKLYLILLCFFFPLQAFARGGFFTQAEVLYWQAEEGGLTYAIERSSPSKWRGKNLEFEWDVGFNVGIGYQIPHDTWQLLLQFTSLQTHADSFKEAKSGHSFLPVWLSSPFETSLFANQVKAHWRLHLGLIDALLSKPYPATATLTLTPQIGIRWGSIRQKFNIAYLGGNFPEGENVLIRMKNKCEGLGPLAAIMGEYAFCKDWALFAKGAASLLYSEFYLHQDEDTLGTKEKRLGLHSVFRSLSPILEGTLGIRWHHGFTGSLKRLTFDLAWDQLLFFSQNQLVRFAADSALGVIVSNQGDLSLAGVHFSVAFNF
jgi:hypothetical protein